MEDEAYLGDGVYVTRESGAIWLDVRGQGAPGIGPAGVPSICLEESVIRALLEFLGLGQLTP
jgi:hypothetical protein